MVPPLRTEPAEPLLRARGLGRELGGRWLFRGLDLSVPAGHSLWVQGPSGAGKSQLLRRLARLVPGPGELWLRGQPASAVPVRSWRASVTYVGQRPPLADAGTDTGFALRDRVAQLAAQQGRVTDDPVALAASWGLPSQAWERPIRTLSGGELQRLWLAIAVARRPDVLLLDEPTAAVDPDATRAIEATLADRTVVWTTHDPRQGERVADAHLALGTP